jgi:hypothetical protein
VVEAEALQRRFRKFAMGGLIEQVIEPSYDFRKALATVSSKRCGHSWDDDRAMRLAMNKTRSLFNWGLVVMVYASLCGKKY